LDKLLVNATDPVSKAEILWRLSRVTLNIGDELDAEGATDDVLFAKYKKRRHTPKNPSHCIQCQKATNGEARALADGVKQKDLSTLFQKLLTSRRPHRSGKRL
jgi:hypothetical protein